MLIDWINFCEIETTNTRIKSTLHRNGFKYLDELCEKTFEDLLKIKGFGVFHLILVEYQMKSFGLKFKNGIWCPKSYVMQNNTVKKHIRRLKIEKSTRN